MSILHRIAWQTAALILVTGLGLPAASAVELSFYKQGLQFYTKGEFDKAIQELRKAFAKKPVRSERVKILKYLGLSFHAAGREGEAEKSFEQCLGLDSSCRVERKDVKSDEAIAFFREVKRNITERKNTLKPKTRILITSPIEEAEILVDGVVLGPVNTSLDAKPGIRDITVRARGYRPRNVKLAINKMVENLYEIDLDKLPGKAAKRERERARAELEEPLIEDVIDETLTDEAPVAAAPPPPPAELVKEPISVAHFLPFGVGQFYNGDYLLGSLLLGAQFYIASVIVVDSGDIATAKKNAEAAGLEAVNDPTVPIEDVEIYINQQTDLIKRKQNEINLAIGAAAGSYIFGVLHALSTRPYTLTRGPAAATASTGETAREPTPPALTFNLQPTPDRGMKLELRWSF